MALETVSLAQIVALAREITGTQRSTYVSDAEIGRYANMAVADLWDTITATYQDYFAESVDFSLSGSTTSIDMNATIIAAAPGSTGFYKEVGVDWIGGIGRLRCTRLDTFASRSVAPVQGNVTGDYTLYFVPNAPVLDGATGLPFELVRWKEPIALATGVRIKNKREQDTSELEQRLARKVHDVQAVASARTAEPALIPIRQNAAPRRFYLRGGRLYMYPAPIVDLWSADFGLGSWAI